MYGDVAYQMFDTDLATDPAAVRGIIGYQFNPNLAGELLLGTGIRDGKDSSFGIPAKVKLDRMVGVSPSPPSRSTTRSNSTAVWGMSTTN
jgi:hypothetical protein